jgi:L-fuconate dehydratase
MFKQLFQSQAISYAQIDPCRLGGINEALAVQLMAAKFGVPVCPHAGGVGLCEYVQHLSIFDYLGVSGTTEGRVTEFVEHLHEHFVDPAVVANGHYVAPTAPGTSITMLPSSLTTYSYPNGSVWTAVMAEGA